MSDVAAVLIGPDPKLERAPVPQVLTAPSLAELRDVVQDVRAPLVWLLDSGALPLDGALDALLECGYDPAVSLPVDDAGSTVEPELGRFTESDVPGMLDAIRVRRMPLRHTYVISMLVRTDVVREHEPPDPSRYGRYAGSEWTARVFAGRPGMLVPASRVQVVSRAPGAPHHALRMTRTGVWGRRETAVELRRSLLRGR